jgi:hypothetical protein
MIRVIFGDSHGAHSDPVAWGCFVQSVQLLSPSEIVILGDFVDCGGTFSSFQRNYTHEMTESYEADIEAATAHLDTLQTIAPHAVIRYLEGNHEHHIERWAARNYQSHRDAEAFVEREGPPARLELKRRGIRYYKQDVCYQGMPVPGAIRLGKCHFVHSRQSPKHAAARYVERYGANVVIAHNHRSQVHITSTLATGAIGGWSTGCLCKLQPLYKHTDPSDWTHGFGVQFVAKSGEFVHWNVPITRGHALLREAIDDLRRTK